MIILIGMFYLVPSDLANFFCILAIISISLIHIINIVKNIRRLFSCISLSICMMFLVIAVIARYQLTIKVDQYAQEFILKHPCRPSFKELASETNDWEKQYGIMIRKVSKLGAYREIRYREIGLLSYGFLYESKRSIILPECPKK